jgi:rhodanese-related sulfurtransferase
MSLYSVLRSTILFFFAALLLPGMVMGAESQPECRPGGPPASGRFVGDARLQLGSRVRDASCFVSPGEVQTWTRRAPVAFVDVRSSDDYAKYHAPNSFNVPTHLVRHKEFLKDKQVVLLDDEPATEMLQGLCHDLRSSGFKQVGVLDGGLASWPAELGALVGDSRGASTLSPQSLFQESLYSHWLFINASNRKLSGGDLLPAGSVDAPLSLGQTQFAARVARAARGARAQFLVILDEDGAANEQIRKSVETLHIKPAYVVDGGIAAYIAFRNQRDLMVAKAATPWDSGCTGRRE